MENSKYDVAFSGTILSFDGCKLIAAKNEEMLGKVKFGGNWFEDESGERIEIEVQEDKRHPDDKTNSTLFARVVIEGQEVKKLEIFEHANGTSYLELDDTDA